MSRSWIDVAVVLPDVDRVTSGCLEWICLNGQERVAQGYIGHNYIDLGAGSTGTSVDLALCRSSTTGVADASMEPQFWVLVLVLAEWVDPTQSLLRLPIPKTKRHPRMPLIALWLRHRLWRGQLRCWSAVRPATAATQPLMPTKSCTSS